MVSPHSLSPLTLKNRHFEDNQVVPPPSSPSLDPPPPPTITVTPEKLEYIMGDTISFCCSAPPATKEKIHGFHFSGTSGWAVDARAKKKSYVYTFTIAGPQDSGAHTCTYSVLTPARRYLRSRESKPIVISVRGGQSDVRHEAAPADKGQIWRVSAQNWRFNAKFGGFHIQIKGFYLKI